MGHEVNGGTVADKKSSESTGMSRKKFIGLTALGSVGAFAVLAMRSGIPGLKSRKQRIVASDLPGEGSIFQPKNPPRA